ncbi:MAG TPA: fumarylacetoacetate hydrolase family protein [Planococcus sp. (in: firmicutes)]|nr:fumarylacetoacetate hydrolase family protein [Planococcus sp. (in: firmicutes)]
MAQLDADEKELAEILFHAYTNKKQLQKNRIPASIKKDVAYGIQHAVTELKLEKSHESLIGYKVSLTSKDTQDLFDTDAPLYGGLTESALLDGQMALADLAAPLLEVELMFIAKEKLSIEDDIQDILRKMDVAPGIEVPDSRFEEWFPKISVGQVIADSAVAGKVVLGEPQLSKSFEELDNLEATLTLNGKLIAEGSSSSVLGHPVHSIQWLISALAEHGKSIEKGMVISSGTFVQPRVLETGTYIADFEGFGSVTLTVT